MIYITGDTHGDIDFAKLKKYFSKRYVTRKDYLIILGDAGIVWSENECYIHDYSTLRPTVLFIDGNHENFELLNKFPIVEYKNAKCHRLYKNVYHINRGEVLILNNTKFFCMGGATSIDRDWRINRVSWWNEENITFEDVENAYSNLEKVNFEVDYVLTHCAPSSIVKEMFNYRSDNNTKILEEFRKKIIFKNWFFGHYHENKKFGRYRCFYSNILELPIMDEGKKKIDYPHVYSDDEGYLHNPKTGRRIHAKVEDLPEWYIDGYGYSSLKGVTDVAFHRSYSDNHLDKDAGIYLHYHGKLRKNKLYEPVGDDKWNNVWDASNIGYSAKDVCLGIEKYSPKLSLKKLKAAINLNYDQYNNRSELHWSSNPDIVVRPFPEIDTPHYEDRYGRDKANYMIFLGETILTEFIEIEDAEIYVKEYLEQKLNIDVVNKIEGGENDDYLYAYDTGDPSNLLYIKKIKYE